MALFEVTRYLGDDEEDCKKQEAASILKQLKQQVKARKKSLGKSSKVKDSDEHVKKEEPATAEFTDSVDITNETNIAPQEGDIMHSEELTNSNKKKKKKRKHKISETEKEDNIEGVSEEKKTKVEIPADDTESDHHKKSKKHKKHKKHKSENNDDIETDKNEVTEKSDTDDVDVEMGEAVDEGTVDGSTDIKKSDDSKNEIGGFTVIGKVRPTKVVKVHRVLPEWLSNPTVISADLTTDKVPVTEMPGLAEDLIKKLTENGITHFFPVQKQVIPALLESSLTGFLTGRAGYRPSDVCVSAPTGSGKTLAFVLPIVQALRTRVTCEIRALAVLPVTDLATQVFKVFQTYCKGTNLKVGLLTGLKPFSKDQGSVVMKRLAGYHSRYDIIVATPGRLVDHINQTEGFNLGHLRYLVIDEADRMIEEVKQDWLIHVEAAVYKHRSRPTPLTAASCNTMQTPLQKLLYSATLSQNPEKLQQLNLFQPKLFTAVVKQNRTVTKTKTKPSPVKDVPKSDVDKTKPSPVKDVPKSDVDKTKPSPVKDVPKSDVDSGVATSHDSASDNNQDESGDENTETTEKKTETQDTKVDEFVGKYATPTSLSEYYIETNLSRKPLIILHMLHHLKFRNIICFTNSVDTTHRLYMLIKLYGGVEVRELSSTVHIIRRLEILKKFQSGKIDVLVCSDSMARGMDIENVKYVISYETPPFIQTYIHRIGRTARAGKLGTAFTMLEKKQFFHFKKMVQEAGKTKLKPLTITKADVKPLVPKYQEVLKQLGELLKYDKTKKRYTSKKPGKTEIKSNTG